MSKKVKNSVYFGSMREDTILTLIREEYNKAGTQWKLINTEKETINREFYINLVSAKRFFNGLGSSERHYKTYTRHGYIVTRINSIAPDRKSKVVYSVKCD